LVLVLVWSGGLVWTVWFEWFDLGSLVWAVWFGWFSLGSSVWVVQFGWFGLGSLVWVVQFGQFSLGDSVVWFGFELGMGWDLPSDKMGERVEASSSPF
jgi:hypothetical protein